MDLLKPAIVALAVLVGLGCDRISDEELDARLDGDGDGVSVGLDCDDDDTALGEPSLWYPDADGDGFGDDTAPIQLCEGVDGYVAQGGDCDDQDDQVKPDQGC